MFKRTEKKDLLEVTDFLRKEHIKQYELNKELHAKIKLLEFQVENPPKFNVGDKVDELPFQLTPINIVNPTLGGVITERRKPNNTFLAWNYKVYFEKEKKTLNITECNLKLAE